MVSRSPGLPDIRSASVVAGEAFYIKNGGQEGMTERIRRRAEIVAAIANWILGDQKETIKRVAYRLGIKPSWAHKVKRKILGF